LREAQTSIIGSIGEDDPTGFWLTAPPAYIHLQIILSTWRFSRNFL
jgi:hypothetical protein